MILLSIIIPVYKVEKYIEKCLSSIFSNNIDLSLYEVILVNDGTPDKSMSIVEAYSTKYSNLKIINQANQGLSMARNNGIAMAKGQYVWCVDSDDWISHDCLNLIIKHIREINSDMFAIGLMSVEEKSGKSTYVPFSRDTIKSINCRGKDFLFDNNRLTPTQKYIYKLSFLEENHLVYYPKILHEDAEYCLRALYLAKSVNIIDVPCYFYLQRESGAITKSYSKKNFDDLVVVFNELTKFENKVATEDLIFWRAEKVVCVLMFMLGAMAKVEKQIDHFLFWDNFDKCYKNIISENLWRGLFTKRLNRHSIVMCILYYLSPHILFKHIQKKGL